MANIVEYTKMEIVPYGNTMFDYRQVLVSGRKDISFSIQQTIDFS